MLRRLATSVAATTAVVLTAAAPAFADHEVPVEIPGNPSCDDLEPPLEGEKFDPPVDVDNDFFTADVSDDGVFLDVVAKDGFVIDAVLVKGGNAANAFFGPDFTHMFSPDAGASGGPAAISHYDVCGHEDDDDETPTPTPTPTEPEVKDETPEPTTTPVPVPTDVPAGLTGSDGGSMAPVGFAAAALMLLAGGAALVRRRIGQQS